jgi:hypothetical protein
LDDQNGENVDKIWNLYYHPKLDQASTKLLEDQTQKLLKLLTSLSVWRDGPYGSVMRFCAQSTLAKVKLVIAGWSAEGLQKEEKKLWEQKINASLQRYESVKKVLNERTRNQLQLLTICGTSWRFGSGRFYEAEHALEQIWNGRNG